MPRNTATCRPLAAHRRRLLVRQALFAGPDANVGTAVARVRSFAQCCNLRIENQALGPDFLLKSNEWTGARQAKVPVVSNVGWLLSAARPTDQIGGRNHFDDVAAHIELAPASRLTKEKYMGARDLSQLSVTTAAKSRETHSIAADVCYWRVVNPYTGTWFTTLFQCSEEDIKAISPEAIRADKNVAEDDLDTDD